jgi:D-alanyl-D-alanine carboxypeptidase/D-alanyl-D-alanine-endopeptidase (penicillin-binding protein 4)
MRRICASALVLLLMLSIAGPAGARSTWKRRIDRLVGGRSMGVAVRYGDHLIYARKSRAKRIPASNEKLLLSMALLDAFGPGDRARTSFAARSTSSGVIEGNLWVLGQGDPTITVGGGYAWSLPVRATRVGRMVRAIKDAGIRRIQGRVMGNKGYFARDWWAPGWSSYFPSQEIPLPTSLTFDGNVHRGRHIRDPEKRLAVALTRALRTEGVRVTGEPGAGVRPDGLSEVANVSSPTLRALMRYMNRQSSNFFAEMLGKRLGAERYGPYGTIDKGARAIRRYAARRSVGIRTQDSSGLSYLNRVSPRGIVRLLANAERRSWGEALRRTLPKPGQGTLKDRLKGVPLRAKTGTLDYVSALSGWVWLRRRSDWAEFSILSGGLTKTRAMAIEGDIVRTIARSGR